jgi:hypothetical protein
MAEVEVAWQERETRLAVVFGVFFLGLVAAGLGTREAMLEAAYGGVIGYGLAALLVLVWGERTRPKATGIWALLIIAWVGCVGIVSFAVGVGLQGFFLAALLMLASAVLARHESGLAPSFLLGGAVWASLYLSGRLFATQTGLGRLTDSDGMWIATATVLGILAATLEHERLVRRNASGTPAAWTVLRFAFIAVWTIVVLSLREDVQWGRLFVLFGADLSGQAGQFLLMGLIAAAVALAAFAFRPAKGRERR